MSPSTSFRETSGLSEKQNELFPSGPYIKCIIFHKAHSFPWATLSENCSLFGTDNVRGQISCMFSRQMKAIVYIDARVLLENTPLVKFIRNYIRDSIIIIGVFSVSSQLKIIFTCSVHSNIKFISSRHRATSSIYSMSTLACFLWWLSIWHLIHYYMRPCSVSSITSIFILLKWKTRDWC